MATLDWKSFRALVDREYSDPRKGYARKTRAKMRQILREMGEFCVSTEDLTKDAVEDWKDRWPDRSNVTANSLLAYLRTAAHYAVARKLLSADPFAESSRLLGSIFLPRRKKATRRHLSMQEINTLLSYLEGRRFESWTDGRLHALAVLGSHTALRAMELLRLKVVDLDLVEGFVSIVPRFGRLKTAASEATIPIPPRALDCLVEWVTRCDSEWLFPGARKFGPWINGSNGKRPADYLDEAGIAAGIPPGTTLLMLRHTWATHAPTAFKLGPKEIQQILRHTTTLTQDHYISPDRDRLRSEARRVDFRVVG